MQKPIRVLAGASLLLMTLGMAQAAGKADVRWIDPDTFSDAGRSVADRDHVMQALDAHFTRLARQLPDGQTLKLEVTDLDLAGELLPASGRDLRVLRGQADWPKMRLRYTLQSEGRALKGGEVRLSDMNYTFATRHDELGYEKRMIERWFKSEIMAP